MTTAFYRTGTVAVTKNSKVVTGTGTNWTTGPTKPLAGDVFIFNNKIYEVENVISDTEIRLYRDFEDSTATGKDYVIMRNASLNISSRIAAQVAQVVNQKQVMIDEFENFLTNKTDSSVPLTDTLGNTIDVTPIPMLDKSYVEKIGGIDSAVNQAIQDINDAFDKFEYPVLTAAQRQAIIDANEEKYAASGMVHMGKHFSSSSETPINEGLFSHSGVSDSLFWGRGNSPIGTSKTDFPVSHIAGAISNITGVNGNLGFQNTILLPPTPDGTVIYDSTGDARGTGKANLNLLTEVDPKYGDSAEDLYGVGTVAAKNEASARAFEGEVKNGDLRNGDDGSWILQSGVTVSGTEFQVDLSGNTSTYQSAATTSGVNYVVEFVVSNYISGAMRGRVGNVRGSSASAAAANGVYREVITSDGHSTLAFESFGGFVGTISNVSIKPVTEEVVTDRVDMFGLEQFDMVMKDGEIFDMIQSQSSTFGDTDVPTVTSVRPDSFFAAYDGQENIVKGKCVRWPDLNRAQKRHIAKYMKERLWVNEDGNLTFTSIRQRSFAGAGNGDWYCTGTRQFASSGASNSWLRFADSSQGGATTLPTPQGQQDSNVGWQQSAINGYYVNDTHIFNYAPSGDQGVYCVGDSSGNSTSNFGYNSNCYLYVLGTVSRLNQGAKHPLNESGAKKCNASTGGANGENWYQSGAIEITTKALCFKQIDASSDNVTAGAAQVTGAIGTYSGRSDGRFYDAIYADGLGGVVDYRLSAYASDSPEEAAKVEAKVENGTYRGLEKLVWTSIADTNGSPAASGSWDSGAKRVIYYDGNLFNASTDAIGSTGNSYIVNKVTGEVRGVAFVQYSTGTSRTGVFLEGDLSDPWVADSYVVLAAELNTSVSGNFTMTDVIGDPANILQTDALKDGWLGSWIPVIPDGTSQDYPLTRKNLGSGFVSEISTDTNGTTWALTNNTPAFSTGRNVLLNRTWGSTRVMVESYKAFAKQTKPSTNKPVYNAKKGLLGVTVTQSHDKSVLAEAVAGIILKSDASGIVTEQSSPVKFLVDEVIERITSLATDMVAPANSSQAIKIAAYQISENGQVSLGFIANTMTHNGTDWGELDEIIIPFGDLEVDTFNDANGILQTTQSTMTAIPMGWTSNHARAGEQVEGVDL